jgi:glycerate kinase
MKVLIAPDSFKGSISNSDSARAIAKGWLSVRPHDVLTLLPMADGGEGTLATLSFSAPTSVRVATKLGEGRFWLLLQDGTAVVELANICGITRSSRLDPLGASTFELGQVLLEVLQDSRVIRLAIAVGGSGSTDGGVGALMALGARFVNRRGESIALGGGGLSELVAIDLGKVPAPPTGGVVCLTDVTNPLLGELGSARVFASQKGASAEEIITLDAGLQVLRQVAARFDFPGAGAAGGTPFGLSLAWDLSIESGALAVGAMIGLEKAIEESDLVITGEGRLDSQSFYGKVVGTVTSLADQLGKRTHYCVGSSREPIDNLGVALVDLAPSFQQAIDHPTEWLVKAGAELARRESG